MWHSSEVVLFISIPEHFSQKHYFLPPPEGFVFPSWSIQHNGARNVEENVPLRPSNWNKRMRDQTSDEEEPEEPEASRPRLILRPAHWNNATEETEDLGEDEPILDEDEPAPEERGPGLCCTSRSLG